MAKVIPFPKEYRNEEFLKLKNFADDLDQLLIYGVEYDHLDSGELVGVVAHRLGNLMASMEQKDQLWSICEQVVRRQAGLKPC